MTIFTHFVFFVHPQAVLDATPLRALPWQAGDAFSTLAPLAPSDTLPEALVWPGPNYELRRALPTPEGWLLFEPIALGLDYDADRSQLVLKAPPQGLPAVASGVFHLALVRLDGPPNPANPPPFTLIAVSNAFEAGGDLAYTRVLRYRNRSASLLGLFADPDFANCLRLPLRVEWPQYPLSWFGGGPSTGPVQQKQYRLHTDAWPAAWLEALVFALRHEQVSVLHPLSGQYEPVVAEGALDIRWAESGAPPLGSATGQLRPTAFAPLALLYAPLAGGFDAGYSNGFTL